MLKHIGKMKNNGARVVVAYRTLPGDSSNALVIGTASLGESYHDSLISLVQGVDGQASDELAQVLAVRKFPDGSNMLQWLHNRGQLKRVPTDGVIMTPTTREQDNVSLDELNQLIAQQKGLSLDELALTDGVNPNPKSNNRVDDPTKTSSASVNYSEETSSAPASLDLSPTEMRSRADALFKQAQALRKQADSIDPPKKKSSKKNAVVEVE